MIIINNKRYYPVGSWEGNQHKFYNLLDRLHVQDNIDYDRIRDVENALSKFDFNPRRNGVVYAMWDDYKVMKGIIAQYGKAL